MVNFKLIVSIWEIFENKKISLKHHSNQILIIYFSLKKINNNKSLVDFAMVHQYFTFFLWDYYKKFTEN